MAYNDDAVLSKLSALNESHESIATAAQWIMFHRRHADRTVQLWLTKLKDMSSQKRLNLIYLANEVVQQSKARNKDDFLRAFSPVIPEATQVAYKGASSDIQAKVRRVVDVWRDRSIFDARVQEEIEIRLDELDKARSGAKVGPIGGSLFTATPSIPSELNPLVAPQQKVSKAYFPTGSAVKTANSEYEKLTNPENPLPPAPVYAARLTGLMKTLANAEGAVAECVKARRDLVAALEKILNANKAELAQEEAQMKELGARKTIIENKKQDVEQEIMRAMSGNDQSSHTSPSGLLEPDRPKVEALTPPHIQDDSDLYDNSPPQNGHEKSLPVHQQSGSFPSAPGIEMLSNLASQYQAVPVNGSYKKRKIGSADNFPDLGGDDGIDADVAEIIRKDGQAQAH